MRVLSAVFLFLFWAPAQAQSVEELQRLLKERDAKIRELNERVQALEKPEAGDEELNRALERTLVRQGALVLPPRSYEIEPQLSYEHWDKDRGPSRYEWTAALGLRAGIGWQSQVEMHVPYVYAAAATASETALGDISFAWTKQLVDEEGGRPGFFGSLAWLSHTGKDAFMGGVPTGGGFNVPQAALTAVKRSDPLVYVGGISYAAPRARDVAGVRVEPGNVVGVRAAALLAASPATSLSAGLNLGFVGAARVDRQRIPDSDTVLGTLQLGTATVLRGSLMLNVSGEFRVSGQVPNFRLSLALPYRF